MSSLRDILHRLDNLSESGEFAGHYKTGPAGQLKAQDHVGPDGARGRLVGDSVEPQDQAVQEYMPMPEPITDDTVMELSAETLARYRAAALQDKQFNLRGIAQANQMSRSKQSEKDWDAAEEWDDEARFFRSVNAKRNRGIRRADRGMAKASAAVSGVEEGTQKKPNATTRHLRDYPVSDKDVAKPVKKPEKKKPEPGVAEGSDIAYVVSYFEKITGDKGETTVSAISPDKAAEKVVKDMGKHGYPLVVYHVRRAESVAEGAPELLKQEMPLVRHIEKELEQHGYEKGTAEYDEKFKHAIAFYRKFGNIDAIKQGVAEDNDTIYKNWRKDVGTDYDTTLKLVDKDYDPKAPRNVADELAKMNKKLKSVAESEKGLGIKDMVMDQYYNGRKIWEIAQNLGMSEEEVQDIINNDEQGVAEGSKQPATTEDVVSKGGKNLGDYLQDVAKIIKKDPELLDRVAQELDKLGPAVKTLRTDDGHEIKIHGNEDDGFRISIKNKTAKGRFRDLDEARMAVELFVARRRKHSQDNSDYVDEK